jgi:hypothetical protein
MARQHAEPRAYIVRAFLPGLVDADRIASGCPSCEVPRSEDDREQQIPAHRHYFADKADAIANRDYLRSSFGPNIDLGLAATVWR